MANLRWVERLIDYGRLARFDRPAGTLLLLWPTLWGLWVAAQGFPSWRWLLVFIAGVVCMRAFGCVVNDMIDYRLDAMVVRTRHRPLAAGRIRFWEAAMVAMFFLIVAFVLAWQLPLKAWYWAGAGLLLTLIYPTAKRWFVLPQIVLAFAFSWGILIAAVTITESAPAFESWLFFIGNALWVFTYDTVYAMADKEEDRMHGRVYSSALFFGDNDVRAVGVLYVMSVFWLSVSGLVIGYGVAYQVALIAAMVTVFRFHQCYKTRHTKGCMAAFQANHWFGCFVFAGIIAEFL